MDRVKIKDDYNISPIITGGWQLSSGHSTSFNVDEVMPKLQAYIDAGFTTFDCGDIYTGVEELLSVFREKSGAKFEVHTKFVPDLDKLATLDTDHITEIVDRSLMRLKTDRLDLVQFHWWDFSIPGYVEAASHLQELKKEGKIRYVGVTNFDTQHLEEIAAAGVEILSNQVQYSLLDQRPKVSMTSFCNDHGISLFAYGTLAGGFLSDEYIDSNEPLEPFKNRSLVKYKLIIDDVCGWEGFQLLLRTLRMIAEKHKVSIANVANRYVLDQERVKSIIVGFSHGNRIKELQNVMRLTLDPEDIAAINVVLKDFSLIKGDIYSVERDREGTHGKIMKYNLNDT